MFDGYALETWCRAPLIEYNVARLNESVTWVMHKFVGLALASETYERTDK